METSKGKVFRCEYCKGTVLDTDIQKGGCICGSRRITIATSITDDEVVDLKGRGYEFKEDEWMDKATAESERNVQ